jgi:hypothetical protein
MTMIPSRHPDKAPNAGWKGAAPVGRVHPRASEVKSDSDFSISSAWVEPVLRLEGRKVSDCRISSCLSKVKREPDGGPT